MVLLMMKLDELPLNLRVNPSQLDLSKNYVNIRFLDGAVVVRWFDGGGVI